MRRSGLPLLYAALENVYSGDGLSAFSEPGQLGQAAIRRQQSTPGRADNSPIAKIK
jgi:hypothetical protein